MADWDEFIAHLLNALRRFVEGDAEPHEATRALPEARHALPGQRALRVVRPRVAAFFGKAVANDVELA